MTANQLFSILILIFVVFGSLITIGLSIYARYQHKTRLFVLSILLACLFVFASVVLIALSVGFGRGYPAINQ
jgi:hypothetical protein